MQSQIHELESSGRERILAAADLVQLKDARTQLTGKKSELKGLLRGLGALSPEERPLAGQMVNQAQERIEALLDRREAELKKAARDAALCLGNH